MPPFLTISTELDVYGYQRPRLDFLKRIRTKILSQNLISNESEYYAVSINWKSVCEWHIRKKEWTQSKRLSYFQSLLHLNRLWGWLFDIDMAFWKQFSNSIALVIFNFGVISWNACVLLNDNLIRGSTLYIKDRFECL